MSCSTGSAISLDEALLHYAQVKKLNRLELDLIQAHQHILAEPVYSSVALPLFTQSAVDGYALRSEDIQAGIREFKLIGEIRAGIDESFELQKGQMVRIFTGGKLPASADTVARQEIVTAHTTHIQLNEMIAQGTDIRYVGEELQQGSLLATQGQQLNSGLIAALSMAGVKKVHVYQQPKIAVLITGDEVSTELHHDAQVFDANAPMILTWLKEQGLHQIDLQHVMDDEKALHLALEHALQNYDLVITTGGVSVGDYDLIRPVSMNLGAKEIFWKVAQKPGKPLYFAQYQSAKNAAYLLGLPGNPAAVMICLIIHVATLLRAMQGHQSIQPNWQTAFFDGELKLDSREQLLRMVVHSNEHGQMQLSKLNKQQSHMLSNLAEANVIARIPSKDKIASPLNYIQYIRLSS